jgi:hypothetical protein
VAYNLVENSAEESGKDLLSTFIQNNINKAAFEVAHTDGAYSRFLDVKPARNIFLGTEEVRLYQVYPLL